MAEARKGRLPPWIAAMVFVAMSVAALWAIDAAEQARFQRESRAAVETEAAAVSARAEGLIAAQVNLTRGLASFVAGNPDLTREQFENFARNLTLQTEGVHHVTLVKGSTILYAFPHEGNEKAVGVNLAELPDQWEPIQRMLSSRRTVLAGPIALLQGGAAFLTRMPIYLTNDGSAPGEGAYWGIASVCTPPEYIYQRSGLQTPVSNFKFALRGKDGMGGHAEVFFGDGGLFGPEARAVIVDVPVPGGSWRLAAIPVDGWPDTAPDSLTWRTGGLLLTLLIGMLAWIIVWIPDRTREAVDQATVALRKAEEKYRGIFENAQEGIFQTTVDGRFLDANPALARMLGFDSPDDLIESVNDLGRQIYVDPARRGDFRRLVTETGALSRFESEARRKDGVVIWIRENSHEVRGADGELVMYEGTIVDISDRKKAERENAELQAQLLHAQKMDAIGTLAGGVAHDFNNLLTGILGHASMLKAVSEPGSRGARAAEVIERAADRAAQLTKQLLGFARRGKMQNLPVDVNATIHEVVTLLSRTIDKNVTFHQDLDPEGAVSQGDPDQIQQVILNLAVNARDAMPEGGTITLKTEIARLTEVDLRKQPDCKPGSFVILSVTDTGTGIPPEVMARIFEPFFTTKEKGKGTGMGLAMVYGIIKNHGGFVSVYTEKGRGTTFRVHLPQVEGAQAAAPGQAASEPVRGEGFILVVDDEPIVRELAEEMLRALGYDVASVANGAEAVEFVKTNPGRVDLVLLDMVMPVMGGRECLAELRRIEPTIRALISTGYSQDRPTRENLGSGFAGYIPKPYRMIQLSEAVAAAMKSDDLGAKVE